jgi:hypothetical protein
MEPATPSKPLRGFSADRANPSFVVFFNDLNIGIAGICEEVAVFVGR